MSVANISKEVWLGADNFFALQFMQENAITGVKEPVDLDPTTKMELYIIDSENNTTVLTTLLADSPKSIDWTTPTETGYVNFKLGEAFETANVATKSYRCEVQVYDAVNSNGVVWFDAAAKDLTIRVRKKQITPP